MKRSIRLGVAIGLGIAAISTPRPARADDGPQIIAKIRAAQAQASFESVVTLDPAMGQTTLTVRVVHPLSGDVRASLAFLTPQISGALFLVHGAAYVKFGDQNWQTGTLSPQRFHEYVASVSNGPFASTADVTQGPDVHDGAQTYGTVRAPLPTAGFFVNGKPVPAPSTPPAYEECSYDKTTFLLHACTSPAAKTTYRYDDPSLDIVLPPEAMRATPRPAADLPLDAFSALH